MFTSSTAEKEPMTRKERARTHLEESGRQAAKAALDSNGHDLDSTAQAIGENVRDFIETAVNTTNDGISQAKKKLSKAKNKVSDAADIVTDHIREKPVSSAAIALAVGVFLGALFRRS